MIEYFTILVVLFSILLVIFCSLIIIEKDNFYTNIFFPTISLFIINLLVLLTTLWKI